jgi:CheY-like chemotaxis protein
LVRLIVVVEGNGYIRNALRDLLGVYGYNVALAEDGLGLLRMIPRLQEIPAAVVWGVVSPQLDDYAYVRSIRQKPPFNDTPFIFLLNKDDHPMSRLENGIHRYIWKPFHPDHILNALKDVMR